MRNRISFIVLLSLVLSLIAAAPAAAQGDNMCVTIGTQEVCGSPANIAAVLAAYNGMGTDGPVEAEDSSDQPVGNEADAGAAGNLAHEIVDQFEINGVPASVTAYRLADGGVTHEQTTTIPAANWILGDPGVISTNEWSAAQANPSAVFISPDTQELLDNETSTLLVPEGGYQLASGQAYTAEFTNGINFSVDAGPGGSVITAIRGINADGVHEAADDRNMQVTYSGYTEGAVLVTQLSVDPQVGALLSGIQIQEHVDNAHVRRNCGAEGCPRVYLVLLDLNDGAYTVLEHTVDGGWVLHGTNVLNAQGHG